MLRYLKSAGGQEYAQIDFNPGGSPDFIANIGMNYDVSEYVVTNVSVSYLGERNRSEEMKYGENLVKIDKRDPVNDSTLVNAL